MHPEPRRQPGNVVDGFDDVRHLDRALVPDPVGHADPADVTEVRQEVGDIEDRGDRLAPARLADEREVGNGDRLAFLERREMADLIEARAMPG
jgi:hypothetical protein